MKLTKEQQQEIADQQAQKNETISKNVSRTNKEAKSLRVGSAAV